MDWLNALAPVYAPLFSLLGVLGGGWLVYRQTGRQAQATVNAAETTAEATVEAAETTAEAAARAAEAASHIESMRVVTEGFTSLLAEHRRSYEDVTGRVEALEEKVAHLEEEQRRYRRWKSAALVYIRDLRLRLVKVVGRAPDPPEEIAADVAEDHAHSAT